MHCFIKTASDVNVHFLHCLYVELYLLYASLTLNDKSNGFDDAERQTA